MNHEPNRRIPAGLFIMLLALAVYAIVIARYVPALIGEWPVVLQTLVYLFFGLVWLVPLRRFLIWMENGRR